MWEKDALRALEAQAGRLREPLEPVWEQLTALLAELASAPDPERAWNRLVRLLLKALPRGDALAGRLVGPQGDRTTATLPAPEVDWDEVRTQARALLAALELDPPTTEEIIGLARRRLLAESARPVPEAVLDLVVLTAPDGTRQAPDFQFGPDGAVRPVVAEINRILGSAEDPWAAADWWLGGDSALGGVPARLLGTVPDSRLVALARALRGRI